MEVLASLDDDSLTVVVRDEGPRHRAHARTAPASAWACR